MLSQHMARRPLRGEKYFRWRGGEVSRVEGLSDAVFALSLTLLVVSLDVPRTFDEMLGAFRYLPVFAVCFAMLIMCWYFHFLFHRRYGLEDGVTIWLNSLLLFVILFYVYPLKFLFTVLYDMWFGGGSTVALPDGSVVPAMTAAQMPLLMVLYSGGFVGVFGILALLELRAWTRRDRLELNDAERIITIPTLRSQLISVSFGVASMTLVIIDGSLAGWAGMIYFLIGPVQVWNGVRPEKKASSVWQRPQTVDSTSSEGRA